MMLQVNVRRIGGERQTGTYVTHGMEVEVACLADRVDVLLKAKFGV
jgi:hypothetical protein